MRAVVLAAGRGTRMRRARPGTTLSPAQRRMAERGLKGLIPIGGHAFLDHVLGALADGGCVEVCLVVAPDSPIRTRYEAAETERVRLVFAVQPEPRGTADALLAAERFAADEPFLVVNADNLYPPAAVRALRGIDRPGLAGFRPATLAAGGIPRQRVAAYAVVVPDEDGCLDRVIEKPDRATLDRLGDDVWVSMTCWRFGPAIFEACRAVEPSARGEQELTDAVMHAARTLGERFRIVPVDAPVLDLSSRGDVATVEARLRDRTPRL